MQYKSNL